MVDKEVGLHRLASVGDHDLARVLQVSIGGRFDRASIGSFQGHAWGAAGTEYPDRGDALTMRDSEARQRLSRTRGWVVGVWGGFGHARGWVISGWEMTQGSGVRGHRQRAELGDVARVEHEVGFVGKHDARARVSEAEVGASTHAVV